MGLEISIGHSKFKDHYQEVDLHHEIDLRQQTELFQLQYKPQFSLILQMVH